MIIMSAFRPLMQLITRGLADQSPPLESPINEYINSPSSFDRICEIDNSGNMRTQEILRDHDVGYIHSIVIPQSYSPTFEDRVEIEIGGNCVWHMPIKILEGIYGSESIPYTNPPMKQVYLPHNLFPLFKICLQYNTIQITLKSCINSYLTYAKIFLDTEPRRRLAQGDITYDIISCSSIEKETLDTDFIRRWNGPTIGFFVDTSLAPSYQNTEISLNDRERNIFTPDFSTRMPYSSSTLYYSLVGNTSPINALNPMRYTNCLNMSRIDNLIMKHNSYQTIRQPNERVQCFVITRNTAMIRSGMFSLRYSYSNYVSSSRSHTSRNQIQPTFMDRKISSDEDPMCCIAFDTIGENVQYAKCGTCNTNITYEHFSRWIASHSTCPMCRTGREFTYHCNK